MLYKTKDVLRMERIKRGWTQEDVAGMLKMARGSYAKYENGTNTPTTENIIKLAEIYHLTTDYLLGVNFVDAMKTSYKQGVEWGDKKSDEIIENIEKKRVRKKKVTE